MLEDGIHYPRRGDWIKRILIGGLLFMFSFLLLPLFIVYGYLLQVMGAAYEGVEEPPEFEEWVDLLITGLVAWLIGIVYAIPIIVFTLIMLPIIGFGALQDDPEVFLAGTGLIWFLGIFILSILVAYLLPAAYVSYARTGRAGAAFDFGEIFSIAFTMEYLTGIILTVAVLILFGILSGLVAITIIGLLVIPFITFYGYMAGAYIMARAVRNAATA